MPGPIYPARLKHVGLMVVFVFRAHPAHTLATLDTGVSPGTHPVTAYVRGELEHHYALPRSLDAMTHCLRPDLLALVYKAWKHGKYTEALDSAIRVACSQRWDLNPYAPISRCITGVLAWCGAAVVETGRRTNADMVIGNTCYNMCYKDKAIASLVILCCCQANENVRRTFFGGPPPISELCLNAPEMFRICFQKIPGFVQENS